MLSSAHGSEGVLRPVAAWITMSSSSSSNGPPEHAVVSYLLAIVSAVNYLDRAAVPFLVVFMAEEFGWDRAQEASVLGAFFLGYLSTQLLGAVMARCFGGRRTLVGALVGWSVAVGAMPFAAWVGGGHPGGALVCHALVGVFEGPIMPVNKHLLTRWIPCDERAAATSLQTFGCAAGALVSTLLTPSLASLVGWRAVLLLYGAIGIGAAAAFLRLVAEEPPLQGRFPPSSRAAYSPLRRADDAQGRSPRAGERGRSPLPTEEATSPRQDASPDRESPGRESPCADVAASAGRGTSVAGACAAARRSAAGAREPRGPRAAETGQPA